MGKIERTRGRKGKKGIFFILFFRAQQNDDVWGILYFIFIIIWAF
jgi:hypothetical protein